ncbi:unnamed protein product [Vicia faba]|uniref:Uncharacterized protein n=1 Tax=Vicia faba TaxID=3906 RepID=A0AAV0YEX9_VICFA|nr:unnamed protein product [Vicia faba]
MVVIRECHTLGRVVVPTTELEHHRLWDEYVNTFRSMFGKTDWGFINGELYGDFVDLTLSSDTDSVSSSSKPYVQGEKLCMYRPSGSSDEYFYFYEDVMEILWAYSSNFKNNKDKFMKVRGGEQCPLVLYNDEGPIIIQFGGSKSPSLLVVMTLAKAHSGEGNDVGKSGPYGILICSQKKKENGVEEVITQRGPISVEALSHPPPSKKKNVAHGKPAVESSKLGGGDELECFLGGSSMVMVAGGLPPQSSPFNF